MTKNSARDARDDKVPAWQDASGVSAGDTADSATSLESNAGDAFTRGILDSVVVGVVQFAKDGRMAYTNAFARRLMDFLEVSDTGTTLPDFQPFTIGPDGSAFPVEEYPAIKCFATGLPQGPTTIGLRHPTGKTNWVTVSVVPIFDAAGRDVQSVIATFIDVTHSKEVEESLRQSEDRYRRLVEDAPDAIVVHQDSNIVFVNRAGVNLWGGNRPEDLIGRSIMDFVDPRDRKMVARRVELVHQGMTAPPLEQVLRRLDGGTVRVEVTGVPCTWNGKPGVQTILRDVTQVRQQQEIMLKFFDHVPLMVGIYGADGQIKQVNGEWQRVLGWGTELSLSELVERCYPDTRQRKKAETVLRTTPPGWIDSRVRVRDGRTIDMSTAILLLSDGTRIGIGKDITDRKQYETELRRHKAELEQRVAARTGQLVRKNDELRSEVTVRRAAENALQDKQQVLEEMLDTHEQYRRLLAYEIHDTFVQDVVGALMYLDLFQDTRIDAGDDDLENIEKARDLLRKSIVGARRMISGLRPPIIDEQGVVAAIEYLVSELNTGGMEIRLEHDVRFERLPAMLEGAIFRIVGEALTNVQRHSGATFAQVKVTQSDHTLRLEIRDFGAGFNPQAVGRGHFGLRGIGERARLFGGTLSIKSAPGEGTDLVVELPLGLVGRDAAGGGPAAT